MESAMNLQDWTQVSEIEIVYKTKVKPSERPQLKCSADIYELCMKIWDHNTIEIQEHFKAIYLNRANKVLGVLNASSGGITGTVADPRLILATGLKTGACIIVLVHNHPSSCLQASIADMELTRKIVEGAKFFDMKVIDHLIISVEGYYSFSDNGLI